MTAAAYACSLLARALRVAAALLLVVVPALHAAEASAQAGATAVPGLRLPRDVVPLGYDARLRVDPNDDVFSGVIDITVRVLEPTDIVWLNAKKLAILDAQGALLAAPEETLPATVLPGSGDVIGLQFGRVLAAGEVRLSLRYTGAIQRTSGVGLFRQQEAGRWYAVTQFEPLDARRVFPSFDEPDRKATWKLTLTVPAAMRAFANMPVEAERAAEQGWREVSFQRSPLLPSYLVAFAVGEFDVRDGGRAGVNNTPISIITPKGRAGEAAYAAAHTGTILAATERYFGRPYPFPKLDLLAYPLATFGGAMENAGLVTYTARILLARPEEMSPLFEQRFMGVTAHEIAHMWFGDYVTMAWWNDLWLNESFASWMASTITNELRPDWARDGWRSRQRSRAMELDRLVTARRIRQPVTEYGEVRAAFDGITYAKGETILTMFEQWLGPEKFRDGVRRYVDKHAWGNATAEDFFAALAATDDALVPALRGFVERAGVPLLDVALDCSGPPALKLAQQRFLPVGAPPQKGEKWVFPACFEFGDAKRGRQVCALVNESTQVLPLPAGACPQWVVANRGGLGYYLPRLTPALYAALPQADRVLAPADYAGLLGDLAMLAGNGALGFENVLPIAARQAVNTDALSALRAYELAGSVPTAMVDAASGPRYAAWLRNHFGDRARALGWLARKGESPDVLRLRDTAVALVADRGQDAALARKAQQLAQRWLTHRSAIPRESLKLVLVGAARSAGKDAPRLFDALLLLVKSSKDANERRDVYAALAAFRDAALLNRALAIILEPQLQARETSKLLEEAFADPATRPTALAWFAANAPAIAGVTPPEMQAAFPYWASEVCTGAERAQFVAAFEALGTQREGGARTYRESLEKIDGCLALRRARQASLNAYLGALK